MKWEYTVGWLLSTQKYNSIKETVLQDRFRKCWLKFTDLGLKKGRGWFFNFSRHLWFLVAIKHLLSGKCLCNPINFVSRLPTSLSSNVVSFFEQPIRGNSLSDCYLHITKYHLAHRRPNTRFYGACRTYANFFYLIPILRRFRIIRCKQPGALHSALFN